MIARIFGAIVILCYCLPVLGGARTSQEYQGASVSPDKKISIHWICSSLDQCKVYATDGRRKYWITRVPLREPIVTWHSNDFSEIFFGCGTACGASFFFHNNVEVVGPFPLVAAVNTEEHLIASIAGQKIIIYKLFPKKKIIKEIVKPEFLLTSDISFLIHDIRFINSSEIFLSYKKNATEEIAKEIIRIDPLVTMKPQNSP